MNCVDCGHELRFGNAEDEGAEGTLAYRALGRCMTCWRLHKGITPERRDRRPDNCQGCEEPMRPARSSAEDYPGTALHRAKGLCSRCYQAKQAGKPFTKRREPQAPKPKPVLVERGPVVEDPGVMRFLAQRRERQARLARAQKMRARAAA